ncbi:MAG: hypothetical protein HLUCCA12_15645 [Rhodobacteraceae bacterium HLUCCA12]|nr:MAG: hypothetical protein HLUCCA12_15645 [Rhodobacteraceae bacterium HLUCCA12]
MPIGHNQGPSLDAGTAWRRHCWTQARADLLPTLPIEVVRLRVRRAAQIGLDYRTYASIRAASGHDVVAFLFSTNALHLFPRRIELDAARSSRLAALTGSGRAALAQAPLSVGELEHLIPDPLDLVAPAPAPFAPWCELRNRVLAVLKTAGWPKAGVVMVCETALEREWALAARLGHALPAQRFFAP